MILVTGGAGQLARSLDEQRDDRTLTVVGRPTLDFDRPDSIETTLDVTRPALVINAAAWTAVDLAEAQSDAAGRANRDGPAAIAAWCATNGVPMIHVSTDYVFDGDKGAPYSETDAPRPTGVYGATKLAGEHAVLASGAKSVILRTSWVYAPTGKNFVLTMLNAARKTDTLRVVADQQGCPTSAPALARAILAIADRIAAGWSDDFRGVYHAAGSGSTTWHGLAVATFDQAARHGLARPTVVPIRTEDWPTPARRPPDSRLDCGKLARIFGIALPQWEASLAETVDRIFTEQRRNSTGLSPGASNGALARA